VIPPPAFELAAAGAAGIDPLVQDIGICLLVAGVLAVMFEKVRIPAIAALLAAGVAIGPVGLSVVHDQARIETIAHLGLTLLLFIIGLEINVRQLIQSGRTLIITGLVQVPLTIAVGAAVFFGLRTTGLHGVEDSYGAIYLAIACGFSSTLLVVKELQSRLELDTTTGRLSIAMLIFQDIWAIIILTLQPNFASPEIGPVVATFAGIVVVAAVGIATARYVLPHAFRIVAKMPELVVSVALAWCFGLGLFGAHLGAILHAVGVEVEVSVSLEMAALIAGATIASLPYAHEVVAKVTNLRDFFVTLFFVALGMGIPMPTGFGPILIAVVLAVVAMALRYLVFLPLLYATGAERRLAFVTSTRLAQVSEFCLVIVYIGQSLGHVTGEHVAIVIFSFVLTALVTPTLFAVSDRLYQRAGPFLTRLGIKPPPAPSSHRDSMHGGPSVVLVGFHRLASSLVHDLAKTHPHLLDRMVVIDFNVDLHPRLREEGIHVVYGDISNADTLKHAHIGDAEVILSTVPDDLLKGTSNIELARGLRKIAPRARIVVNAVSLKHAQAMYDAGADYVFSWRTETSRALVPAIEAALSGALVGFRDELKKAGLGLEEREEILD
jgi:Kef-type K+ transport system membrane component KefB